MQLIYSIKTRNTSQHSLRSLSHWRTRPHECDWWSMYIDRVRSLSLAHSQACMYPQLICAAAHTMCYSTCAAERFASVEKHSEMSCSFSAETCVLILFSLFLQLIVGNKQETRINPHEYYNITSMYNIQERIYSLVLYSQVLTRFPHRTQ
jgi:hypothetical protein